MDYQEFLDTVDRTAYHEGEWRWQEGEYTVTRTNHWSPPGCHNGCGVLLYVDKDGKLAHIEGDPLAPFNGGKLCMRCLDMVEAVNHPDRLKYPLRRAGKRGENKWERISWDEAYDEIVERVNKVKEEFGSHTILFVHGTGRNIGWQLPLFASTALETPNVCNFGLHRVRLLPAAHDRRVGQDGRDDHHRRVGNARAAATPTPRCSPPRRHHGVGQRAAEVQRRRLHRPLDRRVHADGHEDHLHRPASDVAGRQGRSLAAGASRHRRRAGHRHAEHRHQRGPGGSRVHRPVDVRLRAAGGIGAGQGRRLGGRDLRRSRRRHPHGSAPVRHGRVRLHPVGPRLRAAASPRWA